MELRQRMREYWDDRAREDPFHFSDQRQPYRDADAERFWSEGARELEALLSSLGLELGSQDRVLDLGCGAGRLTRALAPQVAHVTALDVSPEMLARAQELSPELSNVEWVLGDGESLAGIEDASHDAIVCHLVFDHIPSAKVQLGYVAEFARVLRPGGWAAFGLSTDPDAHQVRRRAGHHSRRGFLQAMVGRAPGGQEEPEWVGAFVPLDALGAAAAQAGLELERIEGPNTRATFVAARRSPGA
jgi:SAM-dependent methyltransferase